MALVPVTQPGRNNMDANQYYLRHIMAAWIASEEIKGPTMRMDDGSVPTDRLRRQFTPLIENAYCIADLMIELGEKRVTDGLWKPGF